VNVTIIGTGNMARAIGGRLLAGGHQVTVLGKEVEAAEQVVGDLDADGSAGAGRSGDPIADEVVVLAVYFPDAMAAVESYGDALAGKTIIDVSNPVNETYDDLVTPPDGSAAQELAARAGGAKLVKAFNTTFANTLNEGRVGGQPLDVFLPATTRMRRPRSPRWWRTAACARSTPDPCGARASSRRPGSSTCPSRARSAPASAAR
jgi:8-hydroxy-5-deazaflavin:NADPH oxidoreductase